MGEFNNTLTDIVLYKVGDYPVVDSTQTITINPSLNLTDVDDKWINFSMNYSLSGATHSIQPFINGNPVRIITKDGSTEYNSQGVFEVDQLYTPNITHTLNLYDSYQGFVDSVFLIQGTLSRTELYQYFIETKYDTE